MKIIKKLYKKLFILAIGIYVVCIFTSQQKTLNSYSQEIKSYEVKIAEEKENKTTLSEMKENINSPEYIEKVAREKLGMYLPNERVYIGK